MRIRCLYPFLPGFRPYNKRNRPPKKYSPRSGRIGFSIIGHWVRVASTIVSSFTFAKILHHHTS